MRIFTIIIALTCVLSCMAVKVHINFAWKILDYVWDSPEQRENAIRDGLFIPGNNVPLGVARWKNKVFVSMPRWRRGVASALNYVDIDGAPDQPLKAYPSLQDNLVSDDAKELPSNKSIISVFRVFIDPCDRLWVQDSGLSDIFGSKKSIAVPSLAIFDLNTDELIHRYYFKHSDILGDSFFANIIVELENNKCEDAYAYVPDIARSGIVVYSLKKNTSWRVDHIYFRLEPLAAVYNVSGIEYQWADGVVGLALSEPREDGYRTMYFHALSSTKEFYVSTKTLRNFPNIKDKRLSFNEFKYLGDRGPMSQASASHYHTDTKVLFYTQVCRHGIACWNTNKPYTLENNPIVLSDPEYLEFPVDLKLDYEGILWMITDKLPQFFYESLDYNEINYRILSVDPKEAIAGSTCE